MSADRERFSIVLEALPDPDGVPAAVRLKALLKVALRRCRLKAIHTTSWPAGGEPPRAEGAGDDV